MPLLINKDGKQLGPYSLNDARALVLAGKLDADDWAWPDGATDWMPLKDVPGFAPATTPAASPANPLAEEELWRGHPSQLLNGNIYLIWAIILACALFVLLFAGLTVSPFWSAVGLGALLLVATLHIASLYLRLRAIEYVVSTQRVRVVSGLFSKNIEEIELFRVKDTMAHQSFFLRLFGLGTITIISGDKSHPQLTLAGIPGALELRERLRQEVMVLRQRFGVRELDVM